MAKLKREDATETGELATLTQAIVSDGVVLDGQEMNAGSAGSGDTGPSLDPAGTPTTGTPKTRKPRAPRDPNAPKLNWTAGQYQAVIDAIFGIQNATVPGSVTPSAVLAALRRSDAFDEQEKALLTPLKVKAAARKIQKSFDEDLEKGTVTAEEYVQLPALEGDGRRSKIPTRDLMAHARSLMQQASA